MFCFFFFDNLRWLQKLKIVPGENKFGEWHPIRGNGKFALSFLAFGSFTGFLTHAKTLLALSASPGETEEERAVAASKSWDAQKAAFRGALMTYQGLHLSQLYVSNNKWVGLAGVVTSVMDVLPLWNKTAA
eukprot:TRINITY_DN21426_c0_g1_i1.p2 TRINITY_DN21426_c0_g1~~TRINITY_DN21426_c0_g1_i1.p2  ORF type:complete len:131 (-),score=29.79 TRINITY_DN21426_c0_g1_i1:10-402(-)